MLPTRSSAQVPQPSGPTVISIDDDEDHRFLISRRINTAGFAVSAFASAEDAMAFFASQCGAAVDALPAWIVFCDLKMPRMSGLDLLRWLRAEPGIAAVPFFMLSGSTRESDRQMSLELGASDYLVKFPTAEEFGAIITNSVAALRTASGRASGERGAVENSRKIRPAT